MDTEVMTDEQIGLDEVLRDRASFYRMLSSIYFLELSQEQIDELAQNLGSIEPSGDALFDEGMADIRAYLRRRNSGTRQEMAVDYARCILGMGMKAKDDKTAQPYESLFVGEERQLMGDARDEVFQSFKKARLKRAEGVDVPEDHLSFSFEYLAILSERTVEALEADNLEAAHVDLSMTGDFLRNHILNWIDRYGMALEQFAATRFYQGIAKITRAYAHLDAAVVEELLATVDAAFAHDVVYGENE